MHRDFDSNGDLWGRWWACYWRILATSQTIFARCRSKVAHGCSWRDWIRYVDSWSVQPHRYWKSTLVWPLWGRRKSHPYSTYHRSPWSMGSKIQRSASFLHLHHSTRGLQEIAPSTLKPVSVWIVEASSYSLTRHHLYSVHPTPNSIRYCSNPKSAPESLSELIAMLYLPISAQVAKHLQVFQVYGLPKGRYFAKLSASN